MPNFMNMTLMALAAGVSTPALAQTETAATPYGGARLEARVGYEFVSASIRNVQNFQGRGTFGDDSISEAVTVGGEIGYDANLGNIVVGGYANVDFGETEVQSVGRPYEFDTGRNITVGVRVGVPTRGVLPYVKGGYSNGRLNETVQTGGNAALFSNFDRNRDGWHVGAGVEAPFAERFYARLDYTYNRYSPFDVGTTEELRFNRHQLFAGVGIRF